MKIDLHMHSTASDGTDSPEELLKNLIASGIKVFALTDHDTITGALTLSRIIQLQDSIKFIKGIEFSCITANHHKCHILGLNYDESNSDFQEALKTGDKLRHEKFYRRIELLRDKFSITFTDDEINELLRIPSVGKPHIARLIIKKGLADTITEAIERYIDQCRTPNSRLNAELAVNAINSSGGIAVWAHPLGGEGESELPEDKFRAALSELISYGVKGLECYYSKYNLDTCGHLAEAAAQNKLYISGGSDYHGRNKNIPIGKLNAENIYIDSQRLNILEGVKIN